jgi:uncharacterized membrane protein affecting hemolysin expression
VTLQLAPSSHVDRVALAHGDAIMISTVVFLACLLLLLLLLLCCTCHADVDLQRLTQAAELSQSLVGEAHDPDV